MSNSDMSREYDDSKVFVIQKPVVVPVVLLALLRAPNTKPRSKFAEHFRV